MYGPWESNEEWAEWFRRHTRTGNKSVEVRRVAWMGGELRAAWKWTWGAHTGRCVSLQEAKDAVDALVAEYEGLNHPSGLSWWTVFDKEMPWEGALVVLARDEDEAREIGTLKWYDELGGFLENMGAVNMAIPVTNEQIIHQYGEDVLKATVEWNTSREDYLNSLWEGGIPPMGRGDLIEKWEGENPRPLLGFNP